jgi:hypothetical protein
MTVRSDDDAVTALALAAARGNAHALETFMKATNKTCGASSRTYRTAAAPTI